MSRSWYNFNTFWLKSKLIKIETECILISLTSLHSWIAFFLREVTPPLMLPHSLPPRHEPRWKKWRSRRSEQAGQSELMSAQIPRLTLPTARGYLCALHLRRPVPLFQGKQRGLVRWFWGGWWQWCHVPGCFRYGGVVKTCGGSCHPAAERAWWFPAWTGLRAHPSPVQGHWGARFWPAEPSCSSLNEWFLQLGCCQRPRDQLSFPGSTRQAD